MWTLGSGGGEGGSAGVSDGGEEEKCVHVVHKCGGSLHT